MPDVGVDDDVLLGSSVFIFIGNPQDRFGDLIFQFENNPATFTADDRSGQTGKDRAIVITNVGQQRVADAGEFICDFYYS